MTQLIGLFRDMLGSFSSVGKKVKTDLPICLSKSNFPGLVSRIASNATWNVIDKLGREINGKRSVKGGERFTLFISNENMNDIIKVIKWLEDLNVLSNGITDKASKTWNKKQVDGLLSALIASLVPWVISSAVNGISARGVTRAGRGYMNKHF